MINMVRAGLYRLRPVAIPFAAFTALLLASLGLAATGALPPLSQAMRDLLGVAAPDGAAPCSPIDVAGRAGFDGNLLPYAASLPCLILTPDICPACFPARNSPAWLLPPPNRRLRI